MWTSHVVERRDNKDQSFEWLIGDENVNVRLALDSCHRLFALECQYHSYWSSIDLCVCLRQHCHSLPRAVKMKIERLSRSLLERQAKLSMRRKTWMINEMRARARARARTIVHQGFMRAETLKEVDEEPTDGWDQWTKGFLPFVVD